MAYADYEFYQNSYYGNLIDGENFPRLSLRASDYLDYITLGKAHGYADTEGKLAKACCAVAESFMTIESANATAATGELASESVGAHSVSYRSSADIVAGTQSQLYSVARQYLVGTGLLYRGLSCIHHIQ